MEGPNLYIDQGLPLRLRNFTAGGQWYDEPVFIPTRMILHGPPDGATDGNAPDDESAPTPAQE
jgi:hypothetical protein